MKSSKDYLDEANEVVARISTVQGIANHGDSNSVFVDVRDSGQITQTGTVAGAVRVPRGMIEFVADSDSKLHHQALRKDANLFLVCGAGGQAALAGKTLVEMGFLSVSNIGGFKDWKDSGGPTED